MGVASVLYPFYKVCQLEKKSIQGEAIYSQTGYPLSMYVVSFYKNLWNLAVLVFAKYNYTKAQFINKGTSYVWAHSRIAKINLRSFPLKIFPFQLKLFPV